MPNMIARMVWMFKFICDICGKGLLVEEDVRYEVKIEVKSAYDPMEITRNDLQKDFQNEILELLNLLAARDPQELQDEVYKVFQFDLCRQCQKRYIQNPLQKEVKNV